MMIEPQRPASINGNSGKPCFASNARLFIIATAHRVSVGMDAVGPCAAVARAGRPRELSMRQEAEFRLKRAVARAPKARAGQASSVARRRRSVMVGGFAVSESHRRTSKRSSARRSHFRSGESGPYRSACPNRPLSSSLGGITAQSKLHDNDGNGFKNRCTQRPR